MTLNISDTFLGWSFDDNVLKRKFSASYSYLYSEELVALKIVPFHDHFLFGQITTKGNEFIYEKGKVPLIVHIENLKQKRESNNSTVFDVFKKSIALLKVLHKKGIMHGSLSPFSIVMDDENELYFTQWAFASKIETNSSTTNKWFFPQLVNYIAPEQSGKTKSTPALNSDIYALGATVYELATGNKAVKGQDITQTIYQHLTLQPINPLQLNPLLSKALAQIITKCLAKNQKNRYQNVLELEEDVILAEKLFKSGDLSTVLPEKSTHYSTDFNVDAFRKNIYKNDIFRVKSILNAAIEHNTIGIQFIYGIEGSGKENIIENLRQSSIGGNSLFLSVRLENDSTNPLQSIRAILDGLTEYLLFQPEDQLQIFANNLVKKLGLALPAFLAFYPRLGDLLPTKALEKNEQSIAVTNINNQLSFSFAVFLESFFQLEKHLIIAFQNLDKSSANSFQFIQALFKEFDFDKLFAIFTLNTAHATKHLQVEALKELVPENCSSIELKALSKEEIEHLLQACNIDIENAKKASQIILNKSGGQYYFMNQLLEKLNESSGIVFNSTSTYFEVDSNALNALDFKFNNAESYFETLYSEASVQEQQFLKCAAAFGNSFLPADLEKVSSKENVDAVLDSLISKQLIQLYNSDNQEFRFTNAVLRNVLESKVTPEDRIQIVDSIYRNGVEELQPADLLKLSPILIQLDKTSAKRYAELLNKASLVAQEVSAFEINYELLSLLVSTITEVDWANDNSTCIQRYSRFISAVALHSQDENLAPLFELLKQKVSNRIDELKVYSAYGEALLVQQNFSDYITIITHFLNKQGLKISTEPSLPRIIFMMIRSQLKMKGKQLADFEEMPIAQDKEAIYILKLTLALIGAAYIKNPKMVPELVYLQLALTSKYGLSNQISTVLSSYAFLTSNFTENHAEANHVQSIASKLDDKYGNSTSRLTSEFLYACFIANWQSDLESNKEQIHQLFHKNRQLGEVNIAFYNLTFYIVNSFYCETNLKKIESDILLYLPIAKNQKQVSTVVALNYCHQIIKALIYGTTTKEEIRTYFDTQFELFKSTNDFTNQIFLVLLHNIYSSLVGEYYRINDKVETYNQGSKTFGKGFYGLLTQEFLFGILDAEFSKDKRAALKTLKRSKNSYQKATLLHKGNHEFRFELISGVTAIALDANAQASVHLLKAHELAVEKGFYFSAFLAAKKLHTTYTALGLDHEANKYQKLYIEHVKAFGADAIAAQFEKQSNYSNQSESPNASLSNQSTQIDLMSFIKASNSIAGEIKLDQMLQNLIEVLIENAGAQHAGFIINRKNGLFEFASKFEGNHISTEPQLCTADRYPMSILRYCYRSAKIVIEENALNSDLFGSDPYIMQHQIKSIFCLPVVKNKNISGIIYLENNLIEGAFTHERVQILELLASQVAVSLENALLYNEMEQKVVERTQELNTEKEIVETKNKEITDSIIYAKRIQAAILPSQRAITEHLPESFIFYRPKDIVAGDFYWLEKKDDLLIVAAADCTGHGVPGAMVSVICNNGLNRSVREYGLTMPGEILNKTRQIVIQEFAKSDDDVNDGMDIALISLQQKETSTRVYYAGANNPLWVIRKGTNTIEEIKANKQPIGRYEAQYSFETHAVSLQKGDMIYLFTDGYKDQFGGPAKKKFKSSRLKELFLNVCNKPLEEQHNIITSTFDNWKGNLDQIDDVCVMGIRI